MRQYLVPGLIILVAVLQLVFIYRQNHKKDNVETTVDEFDDPQIPHDLVPDDKFYDTLSTDPQEAMDQIVRLSEEMGLYDELPDNPLVDDVEETAQAEMDDYFEKYPFAIEVDGIGRPIAYYVKGQQVTKEGYQWAQWCIGLYHPPATTKKE